MNHKLLIIGYIFPEPVTNAASVRMMQLISLFKNQNYTITFASTAEKNNYSFALKDMDVDEVFIKVNNSSFDDFVKKLNPDIVIFDRFFTEEQFGWRITENCPEAIKILDIEDLHFLRKERENTLLQKEDKNEIALREMASMYRCDLSLIISEVEMELLKNHYQIDQSLLFYLPFIHSNSLVNIPQFEERNHFIFIGNFKHQPNVDAVLYLKEIIWNTISKQLPEAQLHIYGAYTPDKIKQLHNPNQHFYINGWAESAEEVFKKAKVLLAPLRFGAGLKGKIIESMQYGTPFVTTDIGAEGILETSDNDDFITNAPDIFSKNAAMLYTEKVLWQQAQQRGFKVLKKRFSKEVFQDSFFRNIDEIHQNIETHRKRNFIGQMLMHHTMQSTKYLSKWIEEKNMHQKK